MRHFIITLLLLPALALAEPFRNPTTVTFEYPTERVNNTPLTLQEIEKVEILCSNDDLAYVGEVFPPDTTWAFVIMEPGDYTCRARTFDTNGLVSEWSNSVDIRVLRPTAPTIRFN